MVRAPRYYFQQAGYLIAALLTLAALAGCATTAAPAPEVKLTLIHTSDGQGYVDPCG